MRVATKTKKVERIGTEYDKTYILALYCQKLNKKLINLWGVIAILTSLLMLNIAFSIKVFTTLGKIGF